MKTVKLGELSFDLPDGFQLRICGLTAPPTTPSLATGRAALKAQTQFMRSFVVSNEPVSGDGATQAGYHKAQREQTIQQQRVTVKSEGPIDVLGQKGLFFEAEAFAPGGAKVASLTATVVDGGVGYTLSGSNLVGLPFSESKKEFNAIISSAKRRA